MEGLAFPSFGTGNRELSSLLLNYKCTIFTLFVLFCFVYPSLKLFSLGYKGEHYFSLKLKFYHFSQNTIKCDGGWISESSVAAYPNNKLKSS